MRRLVWIAVLLCSFVVFATTRTAGATSLSWACVEAHLGSFNPVGLPAGNTSGCLGPDRLNPGKNFAVALTPSPPRPPQGGPPPGPTPAPLDHAVWGATSTDGKTFTAFPDPFFKEASVADVMEITVNESKVAPRGTLLLYFLDFSNWRRDGTAGPVMTTSTDGKTWAPPKKLVFRGVDNPEFAIADPSVVELPDGRLRLYFFRWPTPDPSATPGPTTDEFWSAVSEDGINFQVEPGVRLRGIGATDPEVVKAGDEWLMIYAMPGGPHLARSRDGLEWTPDDRARLPGCLALMPDGKLTAFMSRGKGTWVVNYEIDPMAPDYGKKPMPPEACRTGIEDATVVRRLDGSYYMVWKYFPPG
jgi:hypothetical protein